MLIFLLDIYALNNTTIAIAKAIVSSIDHHIIAGENVNHTASITAKTLSFFVIIIPNSK